MKKQNWLKQNWLVILSGLIIGAAAVLLSNWSEASHNPPNMGFCIACFLRDIAGSLKLHQAGVVQYFRPEIVGIVLGACIMAIVGKEFKPKGGSAPFTRFILGAIVMIGALVFLGCPLRMVIRIGGGDLNAIVGLVGFAVGIGIGILFLKGGFSLGRAYKQSKAEGLSFTVILVGLFVLGLLVGGLYAVSEKGPGSMQAPVWLALIVAIVVGALAQRSRLCMVGGFRDAVMFKEFGLLAGFGGVLVAVLVGNAILGKLDWGFLAKDGTAAQAVAHTDGLWNFLGMTLVGWGSVLLGGCPLRQLVLAGEGNSDSAVTVIGMIAGAALAHNLGTAGSAGNAENINGGVGVNTIPAVIICFVLVLAISLVYMKKGKKQNG